MRNSFIIITLDGGAASGKSSTARELSKRLNLLHVDTGSHYRALTYSLHAQGLSPDAVGEINTVLSSLDLGYQIDGQEALLTLAGQALGLECLRSEAVNGLVSQYAAVPEIRAYLKDYQRNFALIARAEGFAGLVMEGRDIGSVILPNADYKYFLEADPQTRAARRAAEGQEDAIGMRDARDSARKTAPLICPEGATRIDTSKRELDRVVSYILEEVSAA